MYTQVQRRYRRTLALASAYLKPSPGDRRTAIWNQPSGAKYKREATGLTVQTRAPGSFIANFLQPPIASIECEPRAKSGRHGSICVFKGCVPQKRRGLRRRPAPGVGRAATDGHRKLANLASEKRSVLFKPFIFGFKQRSTHRCAKACATKCATRS